MSDARLQRPAAGNERARRQAVSRQHRAYLHAYPGVIIGFCGMEFVASTGAISAFNECYNNQGTLEACKRIPPVPKVNGKPVPVVDVR